MFTESIIIKNVFLLFVAVISKPHLIEYLSQWINMVDNKNTTFQTKYMIHISIFKLTQWKIPKRTFDKIMNDMKTKAYQNQLHTLPPRAVALVLVCWPVNIHHYIHWCVSTYNTISFMLKWSKGYSIVVPYYKDQITNSSRNCKRF